MSSDRRVAPRPAVLVINPDLPKYGSRFHEYINTTGLAETCTVGLVTQLHEPADWVHVRRLEAEGVTVYTAGPFEPAGGAGASGDGAGAAEAGPSGAAPRARLRALFRWVYTALALFRPRPSEVYLYRRTLSNLAGAMRRALAERRWDRIVIIQSSFAEWLDWLPATARVLLVLHDVRTMMWRRRAAVAAGMGARFYDLVTASKYWAFERRYLHRFAVVICLTDVDADLVRRWFGVERTAVVPLPVDTDYYRPLPPAVSTEPTILFTGTMNHRPNVDAALWFSRAIWPLVRRTHPEARLVIAGMHPAPEIRALDGRHGIAVTGAVPDMRPLFAAATVVVVPLRIGSGARNKILEAWACGRPVVSTSVGAEGLAVADGHDLRLADQAADFAAAVVELLGLPARRARLIEGGLAGVRLHEAAEVAGRYRAAVMMEPPRPWAAPRGPMRACIDMRWMIPGSAGGLEQLARAFVEHLLALDRVNRYTLILPSECRADFDLRGRDNVRILARDAPGADLDRVWRGLGRRLGTALGGSTARWPDRWALGDLHRLQADLAFSFAGFINPELWELRNVVAVPDIQHEFLPEFFSPAALAERQRLFDQSLARAEHICAISGHTRQTLIERLGLPPERISVTYLAADAIYRPPAPGSYAARAAWLERRYGIKAGSYFLFPGHTWHHKNHRTAIEALARLGERYGVVMDLVCVGGAREAQPELDRQVAERGLKGRVRFLGYVPREDMPRLYHGALALVFPSRFEGFGMPVLEAMASGTPVIAADATSLPEVVGQAGVLVPPLDVDAWADAMQRIASDAALRATLAERGAARAKLFSWRRYTEETLAALAAVHEGRPLSAGS